MALLPIIALLEEKEVEIVRDCLNAIANGPFLPDWEFQTLMGVDRETARAVLSAWPERSVSETDFLCAVRGSLNNLIGYPHDMMGIWPDYVSVTPDRVTKILCCLIEKGFAPDRSHYD